METYINVRGRLLDVSRPQVMGILNATPDSFFAGSRKQTEQEIAERANEIVAQGGCMIDVGAFSTRPGAAFVTEEEEMERLREALAIVRREQPDVVVSVDTFRPQVARRAVEEWGADIINDVSQGGWGSEDRFVISDGEGMFETLAALRVPYILTSVQSNLRDMLMGFAHDVQELRALGQKDIILDPGFGFGKTFEENYRLLGELEKLKVMELPLLVGVSRKSMVYKLLDTDASHALNGTTALHAIALMKGANILRVHDVKEAVETIACQQAIAGAADACLRQER